MDVIYFLLGYIWERKEKLGFSLDKMSSEEGWRDGLSKEHSLLFQRFQVQFPAPTFQFTAVCDFSPK